jgi:hypothetical protein
VRVRNTRVAHDGSGTVPLPCPAVELQGNASVDFDLGSSGDDGHNTFLGDPDLFVAIGPEPAAGPVPAYGNTWSQGSPSCGAMLGNDIIVDAGSLAEVETAAGVLCPPP